MKFPVFILAVMAMAAPLRAEVTKLPSGERTALTEGARKLQMIYSTAAIPRVVMDACIARRGGHEFRLAEPGQPFQVTDVVVGQPLLARRLIWAAALPGYFLIHYETGGIAHGYYLLLVRQEKGAKSSAVTWSARAIPLKDYSGFLEALNAGKLDDSQEYDR